MTRSIPGTAAGSATGQARGSRWPMHRALFLIAGTVTLVGTALGAAVDPWFLVTPALVGANQLLFVGVGWCPMSLILRRASVCPTT